MKKTAVILGAVLLMAAVCAWVIFGGSFGGNINETDDPKADAEYSGEYEDRTETTDSSVNASEAEKETMPLDENAQAYAEAEALLESGDTARAAMAFYALGDYRESKKRSMELWSTIVERETISVGGLHIVGLRSDGTVVADGWNELGQCDVEGWTDIIAVSAGQHTMGLRSDGTVVTTKMDNISSDCVAISAGSGIMAVLKADGTVQVWWYQSGYPGNTEDWTEIVAISANAYHVVGLKADGTAEVAFGSHGHSYDVSGWADLTAVSAGRSHIVGLKSDGTVVATGQNGYGQCDVEDWTDIIAVSAGDWHTLGLKADGTVVSTGVVYAWGYDQVLCDTSDWTDIVAINAGAYYAVGIKSDGTIVMFGRCDGHPLDISDWEDIQLP